MTQDPAAMWTLIQADTSSSGGEHAFLIGMCGVLAFNTGFMLQW